MSIKMNFPKEVHLKNTFSCICSNPKHSLHHLFIHCSTQQGSPYWKNWAHPFILLLGPKISTWIYVSPGGISLICTIGQSLDCRKCLQKIHGKYIFWKNCAWISLFCIKIHLSCNSFSHEFFEIPCRMSFAVWGRSLKSSVPCFLSCGMRFFLDLYWEAN